MANLRKRFWIVTWKLSLIAFVLLVLFSLAVFLIQGLHGFYDIVGYSTLPFAGFAAIWIIYGTIRIICRLIIGDIRANYIIMWLGVIAVVLIALFPPWNGFYRNGNVKIIRPLSYSFILSPPEGIKSIRTSLCGVEIDYKQLTMQFCVIGLITGAAMYCFKQKKRIESTDQG